MHNGAALIERHIAIAIDTYSEHQLIAGFGAAFDHARHVNRQDNSFTAQRVGQARWAIDNAESVRDRAFTIGAIVNRERAGEVLGVVHTQDGLINLQLLFGSISGD